MNKPTLSAKPEITPVRSDLYPYARTREKLMEAVAKLMILVSLKTWLGKTTLINLARVKTN